jgi:hypothetical protein
LAESFAASLRRLRKRDCESEMGPGDGRAELPKALARALAPAPSPNVAAPPLLPDGFAGFRFRWAPGAAGRCLEVVHARSGTRFVLSRDGDAWLLAIDSRTAPDAAALEMLNETFTGLGLGAIDVIVD